MLCNSFLFDSSKINPFLSDHETQSIISTNETARVPKVGIVIRRNVGLITGINIFIFIVNVFCD